MCTRSAERRQLHVARWRVRTRYERGARRSAHAVTQLVNLEFNSARTLRSVVSRAACAGVPVSLLRVSELMSQ